MHYKHGKLKSMYNVLSPDGFSITFDKTYKTKEEAERATLEWVKNFEHQGYYSTSRRERIPLSELASRCTLIEEREEEE